MLEVRFAFSRRASRINTLLGWLTLLAAIVGLRVWGEGKRYERLAFYIPALTAFAACGVISTIALGQLPMSRTRYLAERALRRNRRMDTIYSSRSVTRRIMLRQSINRIALSIGGLCICPVILLVASGIPVLQSSMLGALWILWFLSCAITPLYWLMQVDAVPMPHELNLCARCGYDLSHSEIRCPECGLRRFDKQLKRRAI